MDVYNLINSLFIKKSNSFTSSYPLHKVDNCEIQSDNKSDDIDDQGEDKSGKMDSSAAGRNFCSFLFFERLERRFRNRVKRSCSSTISQIYQQVESSVESLLETVLVEFGGQLKLSDVLNNVRSFYMIFAHVCLYMPGQFLFHSPAVSALHL